MPRLSNAKIEFIRDTYLNKTNNIEEVQSIFNNTFGTNNSLQTIKKHAGYNDPAIRSQADKNQEARSGDKAFEKELRKKAFLKEFTTDLPHIRLGYAVIEETFYDGDEEDEKDREKKRIEKASQLYFYTVPEGTKEYRNLDVKPNDLRFITEESYDIYNPEFVQWCRNLLLYYSTYMELEKTNKYTSEDRRAILDRLTPVINNMPVSDVLSAILLPPLGRVGESFTKNINLKKINARYQFVAPTRYHVYIGLGLGPPNQVLEDPWYRENCVVMLEVDMDQTRYFLEKYGNILNKNVKKISSYMTENIKHIIRSYLKTPLFRDNSKIVPLPYSNYLNYIPSDEFKGRSKDFTPTRNCVIDYIISIHGDKISPDTIKSFFTNTKWDDYNGETFATSVLDIRRYANQYNSFNVYLMDIFGRCMFKHKVDKPTKRPIQGIIYNQHIYPKQTGVPRVPRYDKTIEDPIVFMDNADIFKDNIFVEQFQTSTLNNYTHINERYRRMKALKYCKEYKPKYITYTRKPAAAEKEYQRLKKLNQYNEKALRYLSKYHEVRDWSDPEDPTNKDLISFDLNSAYYTTLLDATMDVPVFSVADKWIKMKDLPEKEEMKPFYYVILNSGKLYKDYSFAIHEIGFTNNIMHFITAQEIFSMIDDAKFNYKDYIQGVKIPTNIVPIKDYVKVLEDISCEKGSKLSRKQKGDMFRLCNGLMGKITDSFKRKKCIIQEGDEDYVKLLERVSNDYGQHGVYSKKNKTYTLTGMKNPKISGLNSMSFYNYIVDMTNYRVVSQIRRLYDRMKGVKDFEIYKIITDSIVIERKYEKQVSDLFGMGKDNSSSVLADYGLTAADMDPECGPVLQEPEWKIETKKIKFYNTTYEPVGVPSESDYDDFSDNLTIITGTSGTGKTHMVKNEYKYDYAATCTNMCCRNMDTEDIKAQTLYRLFRLTIGDKVLGKHLTEMKYLKDKTVWIDEYSMMAPKFIDIIAFCINRFNTKFILTGDPYQLEPVGYEGYYRRRQYKFPLRGKEINLTKNYRFNEDDSDSLNTITEKSIEILNNDKEVDYLKELKVLAKYEGESKLDEYTYSNDDTTSGILVREMSKSFTTKNTSYLLKFIDTHLCYTNKYRTMVNKAILKTRQLTYDAETNTISKDLLLILAERFTLNKTAYQKNEMFKVISNEGDDEIQLRRLLDDSTLILKKNFVFKKFDIGYARTVHCVQGQTLSEDVAVHEIYRMSLSMMYTAITRVRRFDSLHIVSEFAYFDEIKKISQGIVYQKQSKNDKFKKSKEVYIKKDVNKKNHKRRKKHHTKLYDIYAEQRENRKIQQRHDYEVVSRMFKEPLVEHFRTNDKKELDKIVDIYKDGNIEDFHKINFSDVSMETPSERTSDYSNEEDKEFIRKINSEPANRRVRNTDGDLTADKLVGRYIPNKIIPPEDKKKYRHKLHGYSEYTVDPIHLEDISDLIDWEAT